jgi:hypothetical protein
MVSAPVATTSLPGAPGPGRPDAEADAVNGTRTLASVSARPILNQE